MLERKNITKILEVIRNLNQNGKKVVFPCNYLFS